MPLDTHARRRDVLADLLSDRDLVSDRTVEVIRTVERHRFVPEALMDEAYADHPLSIGSGQTISQPTVVAIMTDALRLGPTDRVLEVGTGSGYGAAVLGSLAGQVWTIERHPELADHASTALHAAGYRNVHVVIGDGTLGWPPEAPYDAISVTASGPHIPPALLDQLADGGRLVMPVGERDGRQQLVAVERAGDTVVERDLGPVGFVPLIGEQGH